MNVLKILPIFGLSMIDIWGAVPTGFILKLSVVEILLITVVGSLVGIILIVLVGTPLKKWLDKKHGKDKKESVIKRIWLKYGVIGLGLLAPIVTGSSIGMALGLIFGANAVKLFIWMSIGIIIWCGALTYLGYLGILGFRLLKTT